MIHRVGVKGMPVCLTFDTERDFYSSQINGSIGYKEKKFIMLERAIPELLKISDEYDIPYTFFLCGEVAESCKELFSSLKRHAIGVHTHPFTHKKIYKGIDPNDQKLDRLETYNYDEQFNMIFNDCQMIIDNLGVEPKIFRAGKHSANSDTYRILDELGFVIDCSSYPTFQLIGWRPYQIKGTSVWQIPTYCDFSPESSVYLEMLFRFSALMHPLTHGIYVGVIHPMLFGNPLVNTRNLFDRYKKMIELMLKLGFSFLTVEQALGESENIMAYNNVIGKMISKVLMPVHHLARKIIH
jgi:peptidoglycan/xylan/chitin deacetylase (PgdA/CDA1 family)